MPKTTKRSKPAAAKPVVEEPIKSQEQICAEVHERYQWYNHTPFEMSYKLEMLGSQEHEERLEMSRVEYIKLKIALAQMRGIEPGKDLIDEATAA